ncbi:DUF2239 family protein [Anaeromyxobacter sp. Fw109-5]|uniref:DUF2239 family protein n=1 Tax=Anaeromyxobacter sp. (strain Fw109-5) TaxID=404589 RepID=UPI0000ED8B95|nr:DUF2239 family protein [Anaeromyxobacter sp. Fw109-5]ABS26261.1 conserved hypothetical protein [Anaeromyxobacter sp. Fw109-5]
MSETMDEPRYTAFAGVRLLASGARRDVLLAVKAHHDAGGDPVLVFEDATGRQLDFDLRGTPEQVVARVAAPRAGPGRPKLGVVSREVSLLPRHWEWLEQQPNGSSAALRRLVDEARKREPDRARARRVREAAGRFMWAMAGDLPGFEEASRALYAGDAKRLGTLVRTWPKDVRAHLLALSEEAARLERPPSVETRANPRGR